MSNNKKQNQERTTADHKDVFSFWQKKELAFGIKDVTLQLFKQLTNGTIKAPVCSCVIQSSITSSALELGGSAASKLLQTQRQQQFLHLPAPVPSCFVLVSTTAVFPQTCREQLPVYPRFSNGKMCRDLSLRPSIFH